MATAKNTTCAFPECGRRRKAREFCDGHATQLRKGLDLTPIINRSLMSYEERFWSFVDKTETCWVWTGGKSGDGYGAFKYEGRMRGAHRVSWIFTHGHDPEGFDIDHICFNGKCVRPEHLRLATHKQNLEYRRGPNANTTSGARGVSWSTSKKRWSANVNDGGKIVFCGYFRTVEEADVVVRAKRAELFTFPEVA